MLPNVATQKTEWNLVGLGASRAHATSQPVVTLPFVVGRRHDVSLYLPCSTVSQMHAEIFDCDGQLGLRDLGSRNGTFLNGQQIKNAELLQEGDLIQFAEVAFRLVHGNVDVLQTAAGEMCDDALALAQFDRLITQQAIVPHLQPIVHASDESTHGYEALGRSRLYGLKLPDVMFRAAAQLNMETELSVMFRHAAVEACASADPLPHVFLNTHPKELDEIGQLIRSLRQLRIASPSQPITLEIHEAAVANTQTMQMLRLALEDMQIQLAYDDFGAGQSRLVELASLPPDCLKFDRCMVKEIHLASPKQQEMLASLVSMTRQLGVVPLAEGIESREEAAVCREVGFELFQGFLFGRPAKASEYLAKSVEAEPRDTDPC